MERNFRKLRNFSGWRDLSRYVEYYRLNNQAAARRGERRERSMAGVYSCPSNRTNLEWHLQGPQIPNVTIVASVNEQGIKRTAQHTGGSGTRAGVGDHQPPSVPAGRAANRHWVF